MPGTAAPMHAGLLQPAEHACWEVGREGPWLVALALAPGAAVLPACGSAVGIAPHPPMHPNATNPCLTVHKRPPQQCTQVLVFSLILFSCSVMSTPSLPLSAGTCVVPTLSPLPLDWPILSPAHGFPARCCLLPAFRTLMVSHQPLACSSFYHQSTCYFQFSLAGAVIPAVCPRQAAAPLPGCPCRNSALPLLIFDVCCLPPSFLLLYDQVRHVKQ